MKAKAPWSIPPEWFARLETLEQCAAELKTAARQADYRANRASLTQWEELAEYLQGRVLLWEPSMTPKEKPYDDAVKQAVEAALHEWRSRR